MKSSKKYRRSVATYESVRGMNYCQNKEQILWCMIVYFALFSKYTKCGFLLLTYWSTFEYVSIKKKYKLITSFNSLYIILTRICTHLIFDIFTKISALPSKFYLDRFLLLVVHPARCRKFAHTWCSVIWSRPYRLEKVSIAGWLFKLVRLPGH